MREEEKKENNFEILEEGVSPESRMGLLHKDSCCGGRV